MTKSLIDPQFALAESPGESGNIPSVAARTEQGYQRDWLRFSVWCDQHNEQKLPAHPRTVSLFLNSENALGAGVGTLNRRIAAISYVHRNNSCSSPLLHDEASLIRSVIAALMGPGVNPKMRRPTVQLWREVVEAIGEDDPGDLRDRAILSLHISGAFRLAELARLSFKHIQIEGLNVQINLGRYRSTSPRGSSAITLSNDQLLNASSHLRRWVNACSECRGHLFNHVVAGCVTSQNLLETDFAAIIRMRAKALGYEAEPPRGKGLFQIRSTDRLPAQ